MVYRSDSIFEEAAAKGVQEFLMEYMPTEDQDLEQCDILLSSSESTVDSKGQYCSLDDVDPDTNCCIVDNSKKNLKHSYKSQCLSSTNFTQNVEQDGTVEISDAPFPANISNLHCCSDINSCVLSCLESNQELVRDDGNEAGNT